MTQYLFSGTFYAKFDDNSFKIGQKLEFQVSNVESFQCPEKYFDDYNQYKKDMENIIYYIQLFQQKIFSNNYQMDRRDKILTKEKEVIKV